MSRLSRPLHMLPGALVVIVCAAGCGSAKSVSSPQNSSTSSTSASLDAQSGGVPSASVPFTDACDKLQFDVSDVQESYGALVEHIPPGTLDYMAKDIAAVAAADAVATTTASGGGYPKVAAAFQSLTTTVQARGSSLADFQNAMLRAVQSYEDACVNLQGTFG